MSIRPSVCDSASNTTTITTTTTTTDNNNNNNNNNTSFKFIEYLLKSRINSTSAYYKARTKTQIQRKNKTLNRRNKDSMTEKSNVNEVLG
jgi:hypothetical protein